MEFKKGVNPFGIKPELAIALFVIDGVYRQWEVPLVVTSLNDSKHSRTSLHFAGCAADIRIWGVDDVEALARDIREALGHNPDFDVVVKETHIHLEYQPKYRGT